jgi:hypothetical protein
MENQFTNISEAYQKYYNAYMMTTAEPLTKSEFITRVINDKVFAEIWGVNKNMDKTDTIEEKNDD